MTTPLTREAQAARQLIDSLKDIIGDDEDFAMDVIEKFVQSCQKRGGYMPACATVLRIIADELADRFPDDTNGGRR